MKKWFSLFTLILLFLPIGAEENRTSQSDELIHIRQNYIQALMTSDSETESLIQSLTTVTPEKEISDQAVSELHQRYPFNLEKMEEYLQTINADGSWKDIDYLDQKRSGWEPKIHAERILELAKLYTSPATPYHHSEKVAASIHRALKFWFTTSPVCLNWWYNQIGLPKTMGEAFIVLGDLLTEEEKAAGIKIMENSKIGMTGQNKVWLAGNVLIRGLLQNNFDIVKNARDTIFSEIVTNRSEGLKSDWSFHQHGPQQQFGNYGLSFLSGMSFYSGLFVGTSLTLDNKQLAILSSFVSDGYRWILWHGYLDVNALDRQLFHNAQIHKAFTVAFSAVQLSKSGLRACKEAATNILKENYPPNATKSTFTGEKHFWESDLTIHRRPRWMASVKMASDRVIGTELVNEDNLRGFYMGDGATYIYVNGDDYLNVFPFWDWRKIPGITSYESELPIPRLGKDRSRNKSSFVGGVTDGTWGMTTMDLNRDGLQAHKSWIFTDKFVLCLGSGIQTDSGLVVTTSIEQRVKRGDLYHLDKNQWNVVDSKKTFIGKDQRFFHDKTGYIVLESGKCVATAEKRTGQWSDFMGMYRPETVEGEVTSLHLDHGFSPKAGTYQYVIIPATDKETTAAFDLSSLRIIRNDNIAQAVSLPKEKTCWVTVRQPVKLKLASGLNFSTKTVGIYMIRQTEDGYQLWYADPTHSLSRASAGINGKSVDIALPSGDMSGKSISVKISK